MCDEEGMWDRTLTLGSASKLLSLTGWRIGWAYGPDDLVKGALTMHGYTSYCAPTPLQEGAAAALESEAAGSASFDGVGKLMAAHWHLLAAALRATGVEVCPASGGYFLVADVRATGMSDLEYVTWLATRHGVAAVPLSVFFCSEAPRLRAVPTDTTHHPSTRSPHLSLDTHA